MLSIIKMNDDIKIDLTPPSSVDNENRKELLWESREEELLRKWMLEMYESSKKQGMKAKRTKKIYALIGVPATLLPIILSGLTSVEIDPLVNSLLMITTGSLIGISTFFNLGKKFSQHLNTNINMTN